jgi:hypothetical protein
MPEERPRITITLPKITIGHVLLVLFMVWWFTWPAHQWPFTLPLAWFWLWPLMPLVPLALVITGILVLRRVRPGWE